MKNTVADVIYNIIISLVILHFVPVRQEGI